MNMVLPEVSKLSRTSVGWWTHPRHPVDEYQIGIVKSAVFIFEFQILSSVETINLAGT